MFRSFMSQAGHQVFTDLDPVDLKWLIERMWRRRPVAPQAVDTSSALPRTLRAPWHPMSNAAALPRVAVAAVNMPITEAVDALPHYGHIVYAYLIESTRVLDVARGLLEATIWGEGLGSPSIEARWWLRVTEELFFRADSDLTFALRSDIRPHASSIRRNAYYRLLGMSLPHPANDGASDFKRPDHANLEFVPTFEEFLREVNTAIENRNNSSGSNPLDTGSIADLAERLQEMLTARRINGMLSREEFNAVVLADWLHLSVANGQNWGGSDSSPIVSFLRAEASSPEERLKKMGQRLGVPVHKRSKSLFEIADPLSNVLLRIESGAFSDPATTGPLFQANGTVESDMRDIIRHWSLLTGRDVKARRTQPVPTSSGSSAAPVTLAR